MQQYILQGVLSSSDSNNKLFWGDFNSYPGCCIEGVRKATENLNRIAGVLTEFGTWNLWIGQKHHHFDSMLNTT